jgi:hypothetical protein
VGEPLDTIRKEWSVIRAAPGSFASIAAVILVTCWIIVNYINAGVISAKDATIENLKTQTEALSRQIRTSANPAQDIEAALAPIKNELEGAKRQLTLVTKQRDAALAASPIASISPAVPTDAKKSELPGEFTLLSNETVKKRAFELAQGIYEFYYGMEEKRNKILYGASNQTASEKADEELMIENDASEKFKEMFAEKYNAVLRELKKRSGSTSYVKEIGQETLDLDAIALTSSHLKKLAKELP